MKLRIIIIFLMAVSVFLANYNLKSNKELDLKINAVFPKTFMGWTSKEIKVDDIVWTMLEPEEMLLRSYLNTEKNKKINLTIVYTNKRDHIHDPQVCYRGQGIAMNEQVRIQFGEGINAYLVKAKQRIGKDKTIGYNLIYWYSDLKNTYSSRSVFMKHVIVSNILNKADFPYVLISLSGINVSQQELEDFAQGVYDEIIDLKGKNENSIRK